MTNIPYGMTKQTLWPRLSGLVILLAAALWSPPAAEARQEVAAWIPWWAAEAGVKSAVAHMDQLDVVYPFVFEVNSDGTLKNRVDFSERHWQDLLAEADDERVEVIPTIAWFDGPAIHAVLSDVKAREQHVEEIVKMVKQNRFDGVNIDYESKLGETIDYYSEFLKELKDELGRRRKLTCTVEARTPPDSRWTEVPEELKYANDYRQMNRHCDWVEIMAYDQQRADLQLNQERRGVPYMPVADKAWVSKVIELALEDFAADNIMLGVATYGRAWDVTVAADWYRDYEKVATLNQPRILELVEKYEVPIGRTAGGEAVITYFPDTSPWQLLNQLPTPTDTPLGYEAAAKALLVATYADVEIPVRMITWSDAEAIEAKVDLAETYDLRGTAIFKVDGEEDQALWQIRF